MKDCPFCNIQTEKRLVLAEGPLTRVILSNPRLMKGHLLVMPKRHVERLVELTPQERAELMEYAVRFQEKLLAGGAAGCDIRHHYRPFIPQGALKVNHLHMHLQPREKEDRLFQEAQSKERDLFAPLSDAEQEEMREKLQ